MAGAETSRPVTRRVSPKLVSRLRHRYDYLGPHRRTRALARHRSVEEQWRRGLPVFPSDSRGGPRSSLWARPMKRGAIS